MKLIFDWLNERQDASLHPYQLTCLLSIMKVRPWPWPLELSHNIASSNTKPHSLVTSSYLVFSQKLFKEFELQGVSPDLLNSKHHTGIQNRLQVCIPCDVTQTCVFCVCVCVCFCCCCCDITWPHNVLFSFASSVILRRFLNFSSNFSWRCRYFASWLHANCRRRTKQ